MERCDEPWPELLDCGATEIKDGAVRAVATYCQLHSVPPTTEVFALMLTYVAQGSVYFTMSFGLETDRRRWLASNLDAHELASNLWYVNLNHEGLNYIEDDILDEDLDSLLLREAAITQPDDASRAILNAVAAKLATHDWEPLLTITDDFIVYIAEHDEGFGPKHESARAVNPPERLASWDANWPRGVTRGEDESPE